MLSSYRFDSQYHPNPQQADSFPGFRLLEEGYFSPGHFCPILVRELDQLRIHYMQWGKRGIHSHHRKAVLPVQSPLDELDQLQIFPSSRCLIPGNGYYLGTPDGRHWKVELHGQETFCFAAIRSPLSHADGTFSEYFSILATSSHALLRQHHLLMPIIIPRHLEMAWLNPSTPAANIQAWLTQPHSATITVREVQYLQEMDAPWSHQAA